MMMKDTPSLKRVATFLFSSYSLPPDSSSPITQVINRIEYNIAASTSLLAGLILEKELIKRVLREEIMRESVIYQEIETTAMQKGVQQGVQQEAVSLVLRLLKRRLGEVQPELQARIQGLSVEVVEELAEALLDFSSEEDLVDWLEHH